MALNQSGEGSSEYGLKDDWNYVQNTLEQIIPIYDKTNRYISLGSDLKLRRKGIGLLVSEFQERESFCLLDLGCGTGTMTRLLQERMRSKGNVLLVDPIPAMMRLARQRTYEDGVLAVYEYLPLRESTIDATMAGFSLRDARNLSAALKQINRLLKPNGKFLIVDLSKPDSSVRSKLISIYWRGIAPTIAYFSSGRLGLKFGALAKTYDRLPKISEFLHITQEEGFDVSKTEFSMMGGACVILLTKKET